MIEGSIAAEAAPAKPAPGKPAPATTGKAVTPATRPQPDAAKTPVSTTDASAGARSATDSTVRLSPPASRTAPASGATAATPPAKGATPPAASASSGPAPPAVSGAPAGRTSASRPATVPTVRSGSPARTAATGGATTRGVQTVAHLDQKVTYQYNALGRRDPFQPMIGGEFVGADVGGDAPVDVGGMKVVGIVWGTEEKFAMVEDGRGQSMVLRVGDKVMNGVVEALRRDALVVRITTEGTTQSVTIPLTRKGDKANATR